MIAPFILLKDPTVQAALVVLFVRAAKKVLPLIQRNSRLLHIVDGIKAITPDVIGLVKAFYRAWKNTPHPDVIEFKAATIPTLPVLLLLTLAIGSCGAPQPVPGDGGSSTPVSWVSTAETSVVILNAELPAAAAIIQLLPMPADQKQAIETSITAAENSLPRISSDLEAYRRNPSTSNMCLVHADIQLAANLLLAVGDGLSSVGFTYPALILVSLGSLGSLIDELLPVCSPDGGASMTRTIETHLSHQPANLRAFPRRP